MRGIGRRRRQRQTADPRCRLLGVAAGRPSEPASGKNQEEENEEEEEEEKGVGGGEEREETAAQDAQLEPRPSVKETPPKKKKTQKDRRQQQKRTPPKARKIEAADGNKEVRKKLSAPTTLDLSPEDSPASCSSSAEDQDTDG